MTSSAAAFVEPENFVEGNRGSSLIKSGQTRRTEDDGRAATDSCPSREARGLDSTIKLVLRQRTKPPERASVELCNVRGGDVN